MAILLLSCSTNIPMSTTLLDEIVLQLEVNDSLPVSYTLVSQLAPNAIFQFQKEAGSNYGPAENELNFNEYVVLKKMIHNYMRFRFTSHNDSANTKINFELKSCTIYSEETENEEAMAINFWFGRPYSTLFTAEIQVLVTVLYKGEVFTRNVYASANTLTETHRKGKASVNAFSGSINKANNRIIYFTEQFLRDLGL